LLQQHDQFDKQISMQALLWQAESIIWTWMSPVCPLTCNAEAAAIKIADQERVYAGYSSRLQYFEALTSKRMEGMPDLRPSQMRFVVKCSLQ
jgi:hypothetical protein